MALLSDDQVKELAERVLRPALGAVFDSVDATPKLMEDGDPSLLITVHFKTEQQADGRAAIEARLALLRALQNAGDPRFPHFRYDFRGEEVPSDADVAGD